jgi:glycosyltransferase domain-containing protein
MEKYNFTLIVPTHERHGYLKRSIEFFKDLKANVVYCDSSEESYNGYIPNNFKYKHLNGKTFAEKILVALEEVDTNYAALCADDDFILHQSLYIGVKYLENNKEYKTVVGKYLAFYDNFNGKFYEIYKNFPKDINKDINKDITNNAEIFFSNYYQILWAMHSKENLIKAFQIINNASIKNDNFIEMVIGAISCATGGIKFLNDIWGIRELSGNIHWGDQSKSIDNIYQDKSIKNDFNKIKGMVDQITFNGYFELILKSYLKLSGVQKLKMLLKCIIKKIFPEKILSFVRSPKATKIYNNSFEKYPNLLAINLRNEPDELNKIRVILTNSNIK